MEEYYIAYREGDNPPEQGIYSLDEYPTFDPDTELIYISDLHPKSKDDAADMARDILQADSEVVNAGGTLMSWGEWATLYAAFEKAARRFGLVREFRENGVI